MKKIITAIVCFLTLTLAHAEIINPAELVAEAALAYEQGRYEDASKQYEVLVEAFNGSPDLYYALGNSYYKQQLFAKAILNYERCLQRDPSNEDARANLELAQLNCVDKIESIQPVIFVTWSNALRDCFSSDEWSNISIVLFLLFLCCVICYAFMRKVAVRKFGFYGALLLIVLFFVSILYANAQADRQTSHDHAVIMAPTVTVRSTPAESGTQLLIIHEGLKVRVRQQLSGWSEIELSDGNVGWMPSNMLEVI
ncbi:MAG: tetratricopeptide repeat protein [Bacteroidales bacterium]|nr:tetratricopeptide repeat protein [Candidatus Liminaster caballi]